MVDSHIWVCLCVLVFNICVMKRQLKEGDVVMIKLTGELGIISQTLLKNVYFVVLEEKSTDWVEMVVKNMWFSCDLVYIGKL